MNYEQRTGEILKRGDLRHGTLQEKLTPEDYNIKGQVLSPLFTNYLPHLTVLLFPIIDHQFCKVTSVSIPKLYLPFLIEGFIRIMVHLMNPLLYLTTYAWGRICMEPYTHGAIYAWGRICMELYTCVASSLPLLPACSPCSLSIPGVPGTFLGP